MTAEEVVVELQAKVGEFKAGMTEARALFVKETTAIEKASLTMADRVRITSGIAGTGLRVGLYSALIALPVALGAAIDKGLEYAGSLKEQAQQIGTTARTLQEYRYAATQTGISTEQLDKGLQFLTRSFGLAQTGAKRPLQALKDLGFTTKEIAQIIRTDAGEAIPLLADKMVALQNPTRAAGDTVKLFGRAGQSLLPLLLQGAQGIDNLRDAAEKLGVVLSDAQIERAHQAEIKWKALKEVLEANIAGAVADNANSIIGLADSLLRLGQAALRSMDSIRIFAHNAKADLLDFEATAFQSIHQGYGPLAILDNIIPGKQQQNTQYVNSLRGQAEQERGYAGNIRRRALGDRIESSVNAPRSSALPSVTDADTKAVEDALRSHQKQKKERDTIDHYLEEQAQLQERINTADAAIAGTEQAKAEAQKKNIDLEQQREEARVNESKDYTKAQKASLIAESRIAAAKEKEAIDAEQEQKRYEENYKVRQADVQNETDLLKAQEDLTDDRKTRAAIEKRLVDLANEQERLQLEEIVHSKTATDAEKMIAQDRLNTLDDLKGLQQKAVDKANRSPGETYLADLNTKIGQVNDSIQSLEVENLKKLDDYLSAGVSHALGLKGALGDIVTELIRIGIEKEVIQPIANLLFGGGGGLGGILGLFGGGSSGALSGSEFASLGIDTGLPGFASGGYTRAGMPIQVGEQGKEVFVPSTDGVIIPNGQLSGGAMVEVHVVGGENFEAHIVRTVGPVVARASVQAATGGASIAQQQIYSDARNRLE